MSSQTKANQLPERLRHSVPIYLRWFAALGQNLLIRRITGVNKVKERLLDSDELLERACALTSLDQWGQPDLLEPMQILTDSIKQSPSLNLVGVLAHRTNLLRALCNRLYLVEALRQHPSINHETVRAPILVSGIARSGTTYLHRLMAQHTMAQSPKTFEVLFTRDPRLLDQRDERINKTKSFLRKLRWCSPQVIKMHDMGCYEFEECYFWLESAGLSWQYPMTGELQRFNQWLSKQSLASVYHHYAQQLRYLQWQSNNAHQSPDNFWCLKSPFHLFGLQEMLSQFPDVKIVIIHRNPVDTLASWLSLVSLVRHIHHQHVSYRNIGNEALSYWNRGLQNMMKVNNQYPDSFVHVRYQDLVDNPNSLINRVFDACGRSPISPVEGAVHDNQDGSSHQGSHRHHDISWFGLKEADIHRSLGDYIDYTQSLTYV